MKVVFLHHIRRASIEANLIQVGHMARAVQSLGVDCELKLIKSLHRGGRADGLRIRWLNRTARAFNALNGNVWLAMRAYLKRPDFIFTRSVELVKQADRFGHLIVYELHSLPPPGSAKALALGHTVSSAAVRRIVTISRALADDLVAEYGSPHQGCDIVVAHDGAKAGSRPGPAEVHVGPLRVGYFGHLYPGKGMETIAALAPLLPELRFDVYGGTDADLARWRAVCVGQDNLTLHGHIPHDQVAARMAEFDILIAPYAAQVSHVGGGDIGRWMSPLKLFEYMAAERPIVTADMPVLREVVSDGGTALMCPPGDTAAFAVALRRLAADQALRARLGAAGRDLLEAEYTWDKRAGRVLDGICRMPKDELRAPNE
jgi:glycosyltransferase involved in cell wall biosynthesis